MVKNEFNILLNTIEKVKNFVEKVLTIEQDVDIKVGRYVIDAKSILGIFSIDLMREMICKIHSEDKETCENFEQLIKEFII